MNSRFVPFALFALLALGEGEPIETSSKEASALAGRQMPPPHPRPSSPDPEGGRFTLAEATAGLPGRGPLRASFETSMGTIRCTLHEQQAPMTVANFVGLARGVRPFWDPWAGAWVRRPFYDGLVFHRVIPRFMIQGGCPLGRGTGNPGYQFGDEFVSALRHDRGGILSMANSGPGTNGSQFFITEVATAHLDGRHTVFGRCEPLEVVTSIAHAPATRSRPHSDIVLRRVVISR